MDSALKRFKPRVAAAAAAAAMTSTAEALLSSGAQVTSMAQSIQDLTAKKTFTLLSCSDRFEKCFDDVGLIESCQHFGTN